MNIPLSVDYMSFDLYHTDIQHCTTSHSVLFSQMKGVSRSTAGHTPSCIEEMPALLEFGLYEMAHAQAESRQRHNLNV